MSSILKALRKLEEEKAAIGEGGVDIARDILKRSAADRPSHFWPVLCGVLVVFLVGGGIFIGQMMNRPASPVKQIIEPREAQDVSVDVQQPKLPAPAPAPVESLAEKTQIPIEEKTVDPVVTLPDVPLPVVLHVPTQPAATYPDGTPYLKLTAIAYRVNPVERIAIINDLPVMQGTLIEGTEIISILPDKVILSWQGEQFEQHLEAE